MGAHGTVVGTRYFRASTRVMYWRNQRYLIYEQKRVTRLQEPGSCRNATRLCEKAEYFTRAAQPELTVEQCSTGIRVDSIK